MATLESSSSRALELFPAPATVSSLFYMGRGGATEHYPCEQMSAQGWKLSSSRRCVHFHNNQTTHPPRESGKYLLSSVGQVASFCICWHPEHTRRLFRQRLFDMHAIEVVIHAFRLRGSKSRRQGLPLEDALIKYFLRGGKEKQLLKAEVSSMTTYCTCSREHSKTARSAGARDDLGGDTVIAW